MKKIIIILILGLSFINMAQAKDKEQDDPTQSVEYHWNGGLQDSIYSDQIRFHHDPNRVCEFRQDKGKRFTECHNRY